MRRRFSSSRLPWLTLAGLGFVAFALPVQADNTTPVAQIVASPLPSPPPTPTLPPSPPPSRGPVLPVLPSPSPS